MNTLNTLNTIENGTYAIKPLANWKGKEAAEGYRIARIIHKGDGKESNGVEVPVISDTTLQLLVSKQPDFFRGALEAVQDKIIRGYENAGYVRANGIGYDNLLSAISAASAAARFSKEVIAQWFQEDMVLHLLFALEQKGFAEDKAETIAKAYLVKFQELAGRNASMDDKVKEQLQKCLALLPDNYVETGKFVAVAEKIADKMATVSEASNVLEAL